MALPTHNPLLSFIHPSFSGNTLSKLGLYTNLDGDSYRPLSDVIKWQKDIKPLKHLKQQQTSNVPVEPIDSLPSATEDGLLWLGHCTFIFQLNGRTIITDPVLGKVSSVMKRFTQLPIDTGKLTGIDIIAISHNHRDHLDKRSIKLLTQLNPNCIIITGLQIGKLLRRWGIKNQVFEAGWWQQYPTMHDIQISFLPAKHWARRALADTNDMLWGSFMFETAKHCIYFGGDSGLGMHFKLIAEHFPKIDYALIGIGAYMPEWFMAPSHTSPADALQACTQLNARTLIPMHYGTFDLSDEPIFWPLQQLQELGEHAHQQILYASIGRKILLT